ncbi:hypothetical protein [Pedobacter sp. BMA]|uniref:hypothetical protein n=1 Tax=Pedobacter sp. BMA TaxID=1663685 RepID=UPI00064992D8|nr:hypothetical protein [Pedobacter sp. BMA]KLT64713.1 hypothetical protein AB669_13245 [Pedobacter sp. BMA]
MKNSISQAGITCIILLNICFVFASCKKNERSISDIDVISNAKNWFLKEKNIDYIPSWDKAEILRENKVNYLILPSNFNLESATNQVLSRLVIADSMGIYSAKLIEIINGDLPESTKDLVSISLGRKHLQNSGSYFSGNVLILDQRHRFLEGERFQDGLVVSNIGIKFSQDGRNGNNIKDRLLMILQPPPDVPISPVCTDWYWTTWTADGVVISEVYLYTTCSGNTTYGGGSPGTGGDTNLYRDTTMTPAFVKNAKAMCALSRLMENNFFKATLNNFIGETKNIDLTFKLGYIDQESGFTTPGNTLVRPSSWNSKNIDIIIASNVIDSLSSIQVAITLLHEGIHAEIYRKLLSINGPGNLNNQNFPSMFNLYQQYSISRGFSHEYMANYYVDIMANAIKEYDKSRFDIDYYKAIAWNGLKGTNYYETSLTTQQKNEIETKKNSLLANRNKQACNDL